MFHESLDPTDPHLPNHPHLPIHPYHPKPPPLPPFGRLLFIDVIGKFDACVLYCPGRKVEGRLCMLHEEDDDWLGDVMAAGS